VERLPGILHKKKEWGRRIASFLHCYGWPPYWPAVSGRDAYGVHVGLVLNQSRIELKDAVAVARGYGIGNSRDDIPVAYFDAIADDARHIESLEYDTNSARAFQRVKAKRRGGPGA
jgi:hypothetical protein